MKYLPLLTLIAAPLCAGQAASLETPVGPLRFEKMPLPAALRLLARVSDTSIVAEPDVVDDVSLELQRTTLGAALSNLVEPAGYFFEESAGGFVVRKMKTVLYPIDYLQLTRSGSGSASITLGGANNGTSNGGLSNVPQTNLANQQRGLAQTGSDATQVSIQQENQNTFWTNLETELRAMLREGETLVLNRFSGVAQVTASAKRHEVMRSFLAFVNHRITQQVEIEAKLVEVTFRDEHKLGIDWELMAPNLSVRAPLDADGVGGTLLSAGTFVANVGYGRANALVQALQEQGDVKTVSEPRLRSLHNQTAFIKVGEDRPFFRLQQTTSLNQPGTNLPFNQTQESYSVSTITIGTILAVTPQVGMDRVITLDVLPAITRLQSIVTSPDGRQTAPVTEVKQASTIVRLKDGETAVIGGLISEDSGERIRAIPGLSRVPLLGAAFRSKAALKSRTELVIFLTPRLVRH